MSFVEAYRQNLVLQLNDFRYGKRLLVENISLVLKPKFSRGIKVMVFAILKKKKSSGKRLSVTSTDSYNSPFLRFSPEQYSPHFLIILRTLKSSG
jgi:hypothetical protein